MPCLVPLFLLGAAIAAEPVTVNPPYLADGLLRNPGMGWVLYDDASGEVSDARNYWKAQDKVAREQASIFYVRWRWSDVEKREGIYEWDNPNSNFSKLIDGARERGLRLAFRFYVNPTDNLRQSTPDWVREACGEKNGRRIQGKWSPYLDNLVFQKKFATFAAAYGKKFNNPAEVDWIDVSSVGAWGEAHGLVLGNGADKTAVYEWLLSTYANAFDKVLLGMQFGTEFGQGNDISMAFEKYDCVLRRDGFGSQWIDPKTDPGDWIKGENYPQEFTLPASKTGNLKPGSYSLIAAIVNTLPDGAPHLKLAIKNETTSKGASILGKIEVR